MRNNRNRWLIVLTVLLILVAGGTVVSAQDDAMTCEPASDGDAELEDAKLYIEYNYTDGDVGVHGLFDGDGWAQLCVWNPDGALILDVRPQSQLGDLGVSGIFFESREPELEIFSIEDLMATFSEGEYAVSGTDFEGEALTGVATFTHNIPNPPVITSPAIADEDEAEEETVVSMDGLVVEWEAVTETVAGDPVTITSYEVIITKEDHDDPHGLSRPIFDVHLPPDRTSLSVPVEFLEPETLYELEILALEASGNQTIALGFFVTE